MIEARTQSFHKLVEPRTLQQLIQPLIERMPRRYRQLRVRDPDVFLRLPATPFVVVVALLGAVGDAQSADKSETMTAKDNSKATTEGPKPGLSPNFKKDQMMFFREMMRSMNEDGELDLKSELK